MRNCGKNNKEGNTSYLKCQDLQDVLLSKKHPIAKQSTIYIKTKGGQIPLQIYITLKFLERCIRTKY